MLAESDGVDPIDAVVVLGLTAGLRAGESLGLQWGDVSLDESRIIVRRTEGSTTTKSGKVRPVTIAPEYAARLGRVKARAAEVLLPTATSPVVAGPDGRAVSSRWFQHRFATWTSEHHFHPEG